MPLRDLPTAVRYRNVLLLSAKLSSTRVTLGSATGSSTLSLTFINCRIWRSLTSCCVILASKNWISWVSERVRSVCWTRSVSTSLSWLSCSTWRWYSPIGKALTSSKAPKTSQRMRTRPVRMRSQEALKLTGMGSLTDIALLPILRVSAQALENCEGWRRGLATGTLVLEAIVSLVLPASLAVAGYSLCLGWLQGALCLGRASRRPHW